MSKLPLFLEIIAYNFSEAKQIKILRKTEQGLVE
jgi:hypothetical protein